MQHRPPRSSFDAALPLIVVIAVSMLGTFAIVGNAYRAGAFARYLPATRPIPVASAPVPTMTEEPPPPPPPEVASAVIDAGPPNPLLERVPRNVLLLTIDTLRHDLGFMGYPRPITPNLDALAKTSTVFERTYSLASYTPKSMGPMMIGRYGTETYRDGEHYSRFYPANTFLAERAKAGGVRTVAGVCHRYFLMKNGLSDGFDVYDVSATPPDPRDDDTRVTSDRLTDAAIRILSRPENVRSRFFGWFHYVDPHTPYVPHPRAPNFAAMPPSGTPSSRSAYDEEVWFTDREVGRLVDWVKAQSWGKDTAIVVTADHGEAFGDHGHWRHGREVWESLIRVPLIVHVPGAPAKRVTVKRSHIDLVPTIVDLLGLPPPTGLHGKSLVLDMLDEEPEERDVFVDMPKGPYNEARRVVVTGKTPGVKLIDAEGKAQVFDLAEDPEEAHPLKKTDPRYVTAARRFEVAVDALDERPPQ